MRRLLGLVLGLAVVVALPFLIWGDGFERAFAPAATAEWLRDLGAPGWIAALALLASDLVLPVPATAVMAALGIVHGPFVGGVIGAAGSMLGGIIGYALCRAFGRGVALRLLGADELSRGERLFERFGGPLVALSRWLPVFPEVVACTAGLMVMPARRFLAALACGSIPLGFAFATVGHLGAEQPLLTLGISALAPLALWLLIRRRVAGPASADHPRLGRPRART